MAAVTFCSYLEPRKVKSVIVSTLFPSICHKVMGPAAMIFIFCMLSFKPAFHSPLLPSSRGCSVLLHFCSKDIVICLSEVIDIFSCQSWFQLVLHPAQSFSWCILFINEISILTTYSFDVLLCQLVSCLGLTVASCPACRFLRRQIRWVDIPISLRISHSVLWST